MKADFQNSFTESVHERILKIGIHLHKLYYYNRFTVPWTSSGITCMSQYQKGETRKVKPFWIYCSKR